MFRVIYYLLNHLPMFNVPGLDPQQSEWIIKWSGKDEKVFIYSISVGCVVSNLCHVIILGKFI